MEKQSNKEKLKVFNTNKGGKILLNHLSKLCPHYLSSWLRSCTLEVSQGHHVACKPVVHPGKHAVQLCFFRPGLRVGGCTEVLANTLLGVFHSLVLSEVSVSPTLIQGP